MRRRRAPSARPGSAQSARRHLAEHSWAGCSRDVGAVPNRDRARMLQAARLNSRERPGFALRRLTGSLRHRGAPLALVAMALALLRTLWSPLVYQRVFNDDERIYYAPYWRIAGQPTMRGDYIASYV